jgi:hypothetical protein
VSGVVGAFLIAAVIGKWWPDARNMVFFGLVFFWLMGIVQVVFQEWRGTSAREFEDPRQWDPKELPREFRFITHRTTRRDLTSELGEYVDVADTDVGRYDLPSGGAIFVFFQTPVTDDSLVTGVQFYPREGEVPVFPS